MKLFLILALLQLAGHGAFAVWSCKKRTEGSNAELPAKPTSNSIELSEDHATPRPTVYWCAPKTTDTYVATILNPTEDPKVVELSETSIGITNISNTKNLQHDEDDLRRELRHQFDWEQAQIPYLGKVKNEARRATLPAKTGAIFFQSFATCHKQLSHDRGAYDEGLAPSFVVATEPFQFELPELGTCTPKDQYLPIRNQTEDASEDSDADAVAENNGTEDENVEFVFTNEEDEPVEQKLTLKNFGFMWTLKAYHHFKAPQVQRLFAGPDPIIPADDSLIASIRKDLIRVFSGIKQSPVTGVSWSMKFFQDENGGDFPLVSNNYSRELTRTLPPKSVVRFFQLVGECGEYTVYTNQIYTRVYDITGKKCVDPRKSSRTLEGIAKCNFCTHLECVNEKKFLDKIEYAT